MGRNYALEIKVRRFLRSNREYLTRQQLKTINGQIKCGDVIGALSGIEKILQRCKKDV